MGTFAGEPVIRSAAERYLDLLKGCLTRSLFADEQYYEAFVEDAAVAEYLAQGDMTAMKQPSPGDDGRGYPPHAETMVGRRRLDNVEELAMRVLDEGVPGDFVETGVWRGGTVIFMRAVLEALGDEERQVWVCDSFQGLPTINDSQHSDDIAYLASPLMPAINPFLAVSADEVRSNFARYGLLDDRVVFLEGWFRSTLPTAPIDQISLLRLDGDLYESTMDALMHLEPRVSPGGFVIIDDYSGIEACRHAVDDYRAEHGIVAPITEVDWTGVYWRKSAAG